MWKTIPESHCEFFLFDSDMLEYGCTRLEIGVQSVYEDVARDTNRFVPCPDIFE